MSEITKVSQTGLNRDCSDKNGDLPTSSLSEQNELDNDVESGTVEQDSISLNFSNSLASNPLTLSTSPTEVDLPEEDSPINYFVGEWDIVSEIGSIFQVSWKITYLTTLTTAIPLIGLLFTADDVILQGGIGFSIMVFNITGFAFKVGTLTGLETLAGYAYGAGNYSGVGRILRFAVLLNLFLDIFIGIGWYNIGVILSLIGQSDKLIDICFDYLFVCIFSLPALTIFTSFWRILALHHKLNSVLVIGTFMTGMIILNNYLLKLYYGGLNSTLTALAFVVSYDLSVLILYLYTIKSSSFQEIWGEGWKDWYYPEWREYLRIAIPGTFMVCSEWLAFESVGIMAAELAKLYGSEYLSTFSLQMNIYVVINCAYGSFGYGLANRIGKHLGSGKIYQALRVAYLGVCFSIPVAIIVQGIIYGTREYWINPLSQDEATINLLNQTYAWFGFCMIARQINVIMTGIVRGTGQQKLIAYSNVFGYYFLGLPLAYYLSFYNKPGEGLDGLWKGVIVAPIITMCVLLAMIGTNNWSELSKWAVKKSK